MSSLLLPDTGIQVELVDHAPMKMGRFRRWLDAEKNGDYPAQYAYIIEMIEGWNHPTLDPKDKFSLDELSLKDFNTLSAECSAIIRRTNEIKNSPG